MTHDTHTQDTAAPRGLISDIQRFSIHDGPGIRTTVFFKGCNLRCFWCHNPETLALRPELQLYLDRCIGCGACFQACPHGAHVLEDGVHRFLCERCQGCGACAETCFAQALVLVGEWKTVDEVLTEVLRDRAFYETSGGGVTLSGGEPLLQPEFAVALLTACREEGLHTAIETAAQPPRAHRCSAARHRPGMMDVAPGRNATRRPPARTTPASGGRATPGAAGVPSSCARPSSRASTTPPRT